MHTHTLDEEPLSSKSRQHNHINVIHILYLQMITLRYPLLPQATTRGSTTYKPQLVDTRARLSCYEPPSVTSGRVPNMNHSSYSRHKINNITSHNPWLPNQVETIRISHNSHTHTGYQYHQATTQDRHVFTLHPEPQLKGCHSKPQLKEWSNKSPP